MVVFAVANKSAGFCCLAVGDRIHAILGYDIDVEVHQSLSGNASARAQDAVGGVANGARCPDFADVFAMQRETAGG